MSNDAPINVRSEDETINDKWDIPVISTWFDTVVGPYSSD